MDEQIVDGADFANTVVIGNGDCTPFVAGRAIEVAICKTGIGLVMRSSASEVDGQKGNAPVVCGEQPYTRS